MADKEVSPKKLQSAIRHGIDRLRLFRSYRIMALRQYVGHY
jgi:hypothetical protein